MEAVSAASAIVGLAVPVFQCAKALRDRVKLVASEKVELLEALNEYEKDIDLLESLYSSNKELLVQHNLDTDLKELAEIIRELDDWLNSINPNLGKKKLPGLKELWKSGDLREILVGSNAKINSIQRRWQMRVQVCTLASTTTVVGQLGQLDSAQTETTALLQQILTILQQGLSMHTQIEPVGFSGQTTKEVANTTTSIVALAEPKSKKGGSGKSKTRVDTSRTSAPAYIGYDAEKGLACSGVDSIWVTLLTQLRGVGVDESILQDNQQFIRDFVRDYQSESTSTSSRTNGTKAAAAKKRPPPPPAPRSKGPRLPPPPSRKADPLLAPLRSSSLEDEEIRPPSVSVVSPIPPPPPPVESPPPASPAPVPAHTVPAAAASPYADAAAAHAARSFMTSALIGSLSAPVPVLRAPPRTAPPPGPSPAASGERKTRIDKSRISTPAYMGYDSEKGFTSSGIDASWLTVVTQLRDMGVDESILQDKDNQKFMKDFVRDYQSESTSTSR